MIDSNAIGSQQEVGIIFINDPSQPNWCDLSSICVTETSSESDSPSVGGQVTSDNN